MRPAAMRTVSSCSAILALLREFDHLINTETRGTNALRKLLKSLEPLRSDRLRRDDQEDPIGEPIGIELTFRATLEKIGAQVVHFGARGRRKSPWMVREHRAALASSGLYHDKVSAGGGCFGHANAVSEIDVRRGPAPKALVGRSRLM